MSEHFGVNECTLREWRKKLKETGSLEPKGRTGRKPLLNKEDHGVLREIVESDPEITTSELQKELLQRTGKAPSSQTIRRLLKKMGFTRVGRKTQYVEKEDLSEPRYTSNHRKKPPNLPHRRGYPSDLTDDRWAILEPLIREENQRYRKNSMELREVLNGIFYILRAGCPWRYIPHDLPDYRIVHKYFKQWQKDGTWKRINADLREKIRVKEGRHNRPSAGSIDSQSVKTGEKGGSEVMTKERRSTEESATSS